MEMIQVSFFDCKGKFEDLPNYLQRADKSISTQNFMCLFTIILGLFQTF